MIRILQTSEKDWKSDRTFAWSLAEQSDAIAEELKQTKLRITSAKLSILEKTQAKLIFAPLAIHS